MFICKSKEAAGYLVADKESGNVHLVYADGASAAFIIEEPASHFALHLVDLYTPARA